MRGGGVRASAEQKSQQRRGGESASRTSSMLLRNAIASLPAPSMSALPRAGTRTRMHDQARMSRELAHQPKAEKNQDLTHVNAEAGAAFAVHAQVGCSANTTGQIGQQPAAESTLTKGATDGGRTRKDEECSRLELCGWMVSSRRMDCDGRCSARSSSIV